MQTTTLDLSADIIDVRDIIARVEELEELIEGEGCEDVASANNMERIGLECVLDNLKGNGGDEHWRGDWYPITLVRDSYFTDYARELVHDIGDIPRELSSYIEIDWDATARNIRADYTPTDVNGWLYWYR